MKTTEQLECGDLVYSMVPCGISTAQRVLGYSIVRHAIVPSPDGRLFILRCGKDCEVRGDSRRGSYVVAHEVPEDATFCMSPEEAIEEYAKDQEEQAAEHEKVASLFRKAIEK